LTVLSPLVILFKTFRTRERIMRAAAPGLSLLAASACLAAGCATEYMRDSEPAPDPSPTQVKVVVYRPSVRLKARIMPVYDGDRLMGFAEPGGAFDYLCAPGTHLFILHGTTDVGVEMELEAGRTYFFQVRTEPDWFRRRVRLIPVGPGSPEAETLADDLADCVSRAMDMDAGQEFAEDDREEAVARRVWFETEGKSARAASRRDDKN
jgi:hypothetical protein